MSWLPDADLTTDQLDRNMLAQRNLVLEAKRRLPLKRNLFCSLRDLYPLLTADQLHRLARQLRPDLYPHWPPDNG